MPIHNESMTFIIADDEQEACENLQIILNEYVTPLVNVMGVAHDTFEAERLIKELKPDAVFLDIDMPEENAFEFLKRIYPYDFEVIFVTAYDEFAIKAFKLNAVDYIQKPICIEEITDALQKLRERLTYKEFARTRDQQIAAVKQIANREALHNITLRSLNHVEIVDFKAIYSIEGQGNYCKICFRKGGNNKDITTSYILSHYEELLPAELFFRVHKSFLVNCMHIRDIISDDHYSVVLNNNERIPVSRRRYGDLLKFLKQNSHYRA